jgi:hypothetical protein
VAILESPIPSRRADRPLKAAKARHPDIAWALASDAGVRLMRKDSELAERIMLEAIECPEGVWTAVVPSACKRNLEMIEAAPCHVDQQFVAVAKMPVGRCRTHPCPAGGFRAGEAGGSLPRDQFLRRADQGLFQIAMVIAANVRLLWTSSCEGFLHELREGVDIGWSSSHIKVVIKRPWEPCF